MSVAIVLTTVMMSDGDGRDAELGGRRDGDDIDDVMMVLMA